MYCKNRFGRLKRLPAALSWRGQKTTYKSLETEQASASSGSLNPQQQLEESYDALLNNSGVDEAWRKAFFQKVRILVLGRSGVGKTTLIRLMVGEHGPQSISEGVAGVQNINDEFIFSSEEQGVPLLIHDSNGMDVIGEQRVREITTFLDMHQKTSDDFSDRIHVVWYVISAIDPRCIDDGGVMQILKDYKIPLLLIMTHSDYPKVKVTDSILDKLLQNAYPEKEERKAMKTMMVRVKNDGVCLGTENELIIDESKHDTEGLKLVFQRTKQLINKELRPTWITVQAVDLNQKLDMSADVIASFARKALMAPLPRIIPFADPIKLAYICHRILSIMCQIWLVPSELQKVLKETLLRGEASWQMVRKFARDIVYASSLVITVGATVLTAGLAVPAVIVVLASSGVLRVGKAIPILVKSYALQVLGTILYVKSAQEVSSKHRWKPGVSKEEYMVLCKEFAHDAKYQNKLLNFAKKGHSTMDTAFRKKKVKGIIKSNMVRMYRRLLKDRPNKLISSLKDEATDVDSDSDDTNTDIDSEAPAGHQHEMNDSHHDWQSTSEDSEDELYEQLYNYSD